MALDFYVDEVPEGLEDYYVEANADKGTYQLNVEGVVDADTVTEKDQKLEELSNQFDEKKQKLDEFREHNVALRKQLEEKGEEVDPQKKTDIDSYVNEAVKEMKDRLNSVEEEKKKYEQQLEEVVLSDKVKDIAMKHGVYETALPDVVNRARQVFTVKDGQPVPREEIRDDEGNVLQPEKWISKLTEDAPHFFKPSSGTGAQSPVSGKNQKQQEPANAMDRISRGLEQKNSTKTVN